MRLMRVALISFLACTALSAASDLPATYQQAVERAHAQQNLPGIHEYSRDRVMPYWQQKMGRIFQDCFATVAHPDASSFGFVAVIGADGKVLRVYVDHDTNMYECMLSTVKADQFPAPPESPYYLHIDMQFADPPPLSNIGAPGDPPLVVEPNKFSYTLGVSAGWEFDFEEAHERGDALEFFPKGGSFTGSSSAIYVNLSGEDCAGGCISLLSDLIEETLRTVKAGSHGLEVTAAEPILTKDGTRAEIRIVKGAKDPRDPKFTDNEALAFLAHDEAIILVVLASRDPNAWQQDYAAFQQIVAGHRFFTCNTPSLRVPCTNDSRRDQPQNRLRVPASVLAPYKI